MNMLPKVDVSEVPSPEKTNEAIVAKLLPLMLSAISHDRTSF
jgi:hypothetical protein